MAGEVKHTPGPWKVASSIENDFVGVFPDTGEAEFAICKMPEFIKRERNEANARLIAAAPDLLETLKALDEAMCAGFDTQSGRMGVRKALVNSRAAIAKAEGLS